MRVGVRNITLLLICCVWIVGTCQGQVTTEPERDNVDSRMMGLDWWNGSRAYPNGEIPSGAYVAAYARLKQYEQLQSRSNIEWKNMGPHNISGRMLSVAVNPQNPNTVYAGSASGGLWRSRSGGKGADAWEAVQTDFPLLAASCIAYHPQDSNIMVLGTGEVYNYQAVGTGTVVWRTRGTYGFGILMSYDGGNTWTHSLNWAYTNLRGVNKVVFDPHDSNRIYAATTEGVYMTPNLGADWFLMLNKKMVTDLVIHPEQQGLILAVAGNLQHPDRGVYRSLDGGGIWTKVNLGVEFFGKIELAMAPSAPDTVYASVGYAVDAPSELRISTDFGLNWAPIGNQAFTYGWFAHDVVVSPTNPEAVICAGYDVWKLNFGLNTLTKKTDWQAGYRAANAPGTPDGPSNYVHQNIHEIQFDPSNAQRIYFATDGGIYLTEDGGETFTNCNGGLQTAQFYPGVSSDPLDSTFFLGGLQNNGTAIYEGSTSWRRVLGEEGGFTAIDPRNPATILTGSSWLKTYRSTNRGFSFQEVGIPTQSQASTNFISPFVMAPGHPDRIYFGASSVYRTDDVASSIISASGDNFDSGRKVISIGVSFQNKDKLYVSTSPLTQGSLGNVVVTPPAKILRSTDGGSSWTNLSQNLPDRLTMDLAVHPRNDDIVYAVMSGFGTHHVFKTLNGGETWIAVGQGLPDVPFQAVVLDPLQPKHVYVGGDLGVWFSEDEGQTWEYLTGELGDPVVVTDLSISAANRKLRVASFGRGMLEMPLMHEAWATAAEQALDGDFWHISPNPSAGNAAVKATLTESANISIDLLGLDGRVIQRVVSSEWLAAGSVEVNLQADDLPAGVYVLRIRSDRGTKAIRWVKSR
ncbi:MAG: T9SS type A sorting domain-containing protein [Bacteroidia bacterium]|nr:T9SS type A sorting domain-containing protein [Bacteroidia bacterium]